MDTYTTEIPTTGEYNNWEHHCTSIACWADLGDALVYQFDCAKERILAHTAKDAWDILEELLQHNAPSETE